MKPFLLILFVASVQSCSVNAKQCQNDDDCFDNETCESQACVFLQKVTKDAGTKFDASPKDSSDAPAVDLCGNGEIDPGELCDGENLNKKTCSEFEFKKGNLKCDEDCKGFSDSQCFSTYTEIAAGYHHSCAVKPDGKIACWGTNAYGQLDSPSGSFRFISVGVDYSCAIRKDETVRCWGRNDREQASFPSGSFTQVSTGDEHACGVLRNGSVKCLGDESDGRTTPPADSFSQVSAGGDHTCGIKTDQTLECWGEDFGGLTDSPTGKFLQVSAGPYQSCAVKTDRSVVCWG